MTIRNEIRRKYLRRTLDVLLVLGLLIIIFNPDAKAWLMRKLMAVGLFHAEMSKSEKAPATDAPPVSFLYVDGQGRTFNTTDLKGKVVFVNFWASWCPPCRAEMPSLNNLYQHFKKDDRFMFVFISEDQDHAKAIQYLKSQQFDIPFSVRTGDVADNIFSGTLPTSVVLNKKGQMIYKHEGMADYDTKSFIQQLEQEAQVK